MAKTKVDKKEIENTLGEVDKFYIENNTDMSIEELAQKLSKPIAVIESYCKTALERLNSQGRVNKLLSKPAKHGGVVSMTQAASMEGDDAQKRYISLDAINRAIQDGDIQRASELKMKYEQQQKQDKLAAKERYSGKIHYIIKPNDDEGPY